jgi:hypothetical protein
MATRRTTLMLVLTLLAVSATRLAKAEEAVLLTATAPGYAPGMAVTATDKLVLPEGTSITLLFRSGQMLRLRGPFEGSLDHVQPMAESSAVPTLAKLFRLQGVDATVIGGTRTLGATATVDGDVLVDPQRSATYCLGSQSTVWIARPQNEREGSAEDSYGVRRRSSTRTISWTGGATRAAWPDDVPIEDGDHFTVVAGSAVRATVTFRVLGTGFPSEAAKVAAGVLAGCHEQFDEPLHHLALATVQPELWLTSERGRSPVYHPGETIRLSVQSNADGWLYCVAARDDKTMVPIFPAGAVDGARLRAAVPVSIPGSRRGGEVRAGGKGTERIACWLADRDISAELPHALLDPAAGRLPEGVASDLDSVFAAAGGQATVRGELAITVE